MHRLIAISLAGGALASGPADSAGTVAGTAIANQAEITYEIGVETRVRASNVALFQVAEVIDVDILLQTPERLVSPGAVSQPLNFTITNTGNGSESFVLASIAAVDGDDFDPELPAQVLLIDADASGDISMADINYVPGVNDPVLAPGESVDVFFLGNIPAGVTDGLIGFAGIQVQSTTGIGAIGDVVAARGDTGVDAVLGPSGGSAQATGEYLVGEIGLELTKLATVTDPHGGARPIPGAQIAYTIQIAAAGTGRAVAAVLQDAIPDNTEYVPGSLRLNGIALTDTPDVDAGEFSPATPEVIVLLGDMSPVDGAQVVEFMVKIN